MPTDKDIKHLTNALPAATMRLKQRLSERLIAKITGQNNREWISEKRSFWWAYLPVLLVAVIGSAITLAAFVQSLNWGKERVKIAFQEASQDRILVIQREIKQSLGIIQDIASFFEASEIVGRREFRKFVGPALKRQAGIKALKWVPVVPGKERDAFVEEARHSFAPFQLLERNNSGELISSKPRPIYYPVLYIQPYQPNKESLGLDMGVDPVISKLLAEAEISREIEVSPGIDLYQGNEQKTGIVVIVPVFFNDDQSKTTTTQAPREIRGFALGIFYIGDIIERAMESLRAGGVDIHFYQDETAADRRLLYSHFSRLNENPISYTDSDAPEITYTERIRVGNQLWQIACNSASDKFTADTWSSWVIFFGGIAFTLLFTVYVTTLVGRARQVRLEVEERTSQLWEVVQVLNQEVIERKSAEEELHKLNETLEHHIANRTAEAERRAQYLEQFAYVTSHDLKAPLRAVSNLAQWIEEDLADKLDAASKEQLALLRDRVRRMHDLIEGLLEYSRVGRTSDPESEIDTKEMINEIIDSLSPPEGFTIKFKSKMPILYADRLQLGQVFSNLIGNSLKHHGGDKGKIRIKCELINEFYQFSVCDNGQGIAPEYHDKVFKIFQTLESSDFESSTGIGLALVKKIIEEHGGTIRLESAPGEGACFHFTWPKTHASD